MNKRKMTVSECKVLFALIEEIGPSEILRAIGRRIVCNCDDINLSDRSDFRDILHKIAKKLEN